jgi:hypothetical protein
MSEPNLSGSAKLTVPNKQGQTTMMMEDVKNDNTEIEFMNKPLN